MNSEPVLKPDLPGLPKLRSGKVREVFDLGDRLLMVASDRISPFDVIMPNGIPRKGEVLPQISHFWFEKFSTLVPNHLLLLANEPPGVPALAGLPPVQLADLQRRSMVVKKASPLAIECVVRGYLAGSGRKEYQKTQTVCGIKLPPGLKESSELPEPLFTPSTTHWTKDLASLVACLAPSPPARGQYHNRFPTKLSHRLPIAIRFFHPPMARGDCPASQISHPASGSHNNRSPSPWHGLV